MSSEAASALSSLWFTYLLRSGAAYLLVWILCRCVRDSHIRFRLCGIFLGGIVAEWVSLFLLPAVAASSARNTMALQPVPDSSGSWTLSLVLAPRVATILPLLCWAYLAILVLFLLHFCTRFWQLNTLLRTSQPAGHELSVLFESVRSEIRAPKCDLRLVRDLRSPAATGWLSPKILLPDEFTLRLEVSQLKDILRHELMHVRRRDYLWDRLATLGCYLVFFHPVAWLVRRRLRWERELVCDEGAVDCSDERRLAFAACLTTLASWRLSGENFAGQVDLLSSPSLLATRVRALVSPATRKYSTQKVAALTLLAATSLGLAIALIPEVQVTSDSSVQEVASSHAVQTQEPQSRPQIPKPDPRVPGPEPKVVSNRPAPQVPRGVASHAYARSSSSNSEVPVSTRIRSSPTPVPAQSKPARGHTIWGFVPRAGGWAIHSVKLGVSKVGSHFVGRKHEQEPSGQFSSVAAKTPAHPL